MATQASTSTRTVQPTKARYWVVVFAVTLAVLSYIDRVAISQAAPVIQRELGFTSTQMGAIFSAFAVAYAIFEIPGGWMGDWMGARKVLMRIVIWWSAFTALTGYMWNFGSMYVCRFFTIGMPASTPLPPLLVQHLLHSSMWAVLGKPQNARTIRCRAGGRGRTASLPI